MNHSLKDTFNTIGLRLTTPRTMIFQTLNDGSQPLSTAQIIKKNPTIDRVTIYRTLALFEELHIVDRITTGWKHVYELAEPFKPHHHHLICTVCGSITKIQSQQIERIVARITNDNDFLPASHHFEIRGVCSKCHAKNTSIHIR